MNSMDCDVGLKSTIDNTKTLSGAASVGMVNSLPVMLYSSLNSSFSLFGKHKIHLCPWYMYVF